MKFKKMVARLKARQAAWDRLNNKDQAASTRPGSVKRK
jgi:hypothetical protein